MYMVSIMCPFCSKKNAQKPIKEWTYGKNTSVKRFKCECEKLFNFYDNGNKNWTIPKKK